MLTGLKSMPCPNINYRLTTHGPLAFRNPKSAIRIPKSAI